MQYRALWLLVTALLWSAGASAESAPPSGLWDAIVIANDVEVPFRFELTQRAGQMTGAFFNGSERVRSTSGSFSHDTLRLRFDHYASALEARWTDGKLSGRYQRAGRNGYDFRATPHSSLKPSQPATTEPVPTIAGDWEIAIKGTKEAAWRLFVRQDGAQISASILRVDGDTGQLDGSYAAGKFVLSHFSGARPLLLELTAENDGSLSVLENGKTRYVALRSAAARAQHLPEPADPSRWTSVKDPLQPLRFRGSDLAGHAVTESDPRFKGKVLLVNVMGSWCPNCHDEAPFLAALYRKYHSRGLEIVALSFEDEAQMRDPQRLRAFVKAYAIPYPVLLSGEPSEAGDKLPQAVHLTTWPTTFFVGRDGLVRGAHAGFASKATGAAHEQLKAEIERTVSSLLKERP